MERVQSGGLFVRHPTVLSYSDQDDLFKKFTIVTVYSPHHAIIPPAGFYRGVPWAAPGTKLSEGLDVVDSERHYDLARRVQRSQR